MSLLSPGARPASCRGSAVTAAAEVTHPRSGKVARPSGRPATASAHRAAITLWQQNLRGASATSRTAGRPAAEEEEEEEGISASYAAPPSARRTGQSVLRQSSILTLLEEEIFGREIVYRRELRSVITTGAEIMDELFTGT
jgi:hypothetical protein